VIATCARNRERQRAVLFAIVLAGVAEALDGLDHVEALAGVEPGERLVEEQDLGIVDERPGERGLLAHAVRVPLDEPVGRPLELKESQPELEIWVEPSLSGRLAWTLKIESTSLTDPKSRRYWVAAVGRPQIQRCRMAAVPKPERGPTAKPSHGLAQKEGPFVAAA